jgi:endonuclease YncB( thermonuclease family)
MVRCPTLLAGILLVVALGFGAPAPAPSPRSLVATVEQVSDGDSVTAIADNGTKIRIRLLGIDAPEIAHGKKPGQPFGEEARDYLDHLIGGKTIPVDAYGPDQYNRVLGVLWDEQLNVNLLVVAMGYAEMYRGAPCQALCRDLEQAEAQARRDRVGMWAQGEKYDSPRDFRRRMRIAGGQPVSTGDTTNTVIVVDGPKEQYLERLRQMRELARAGQSAPLDATAVAVSARGHANNGSGPA